MKTVLDDLLDLCENTVQTCNGHTHKDDPFYKFNGGFIRCLNEPTRVIRWSDRESFACDEHVEGIKGYAARDGSDRTDNPSINAYSNDPIVSKYWGDLLKRAKKV